MAVVLDLLNKDQRPRHPEKAHRPDQPVQQRKPDWIRVKAPGSPKWAETNRIVRENKLVTVCEEAGCPNIGECWEKKHATFMIMGDTCTRACAFCNVKTGLPQALDPNEPESVAKAVEKLGLEHVVITSVDRDDLTDGGAQHFADVIHAIRARSPKTTIEILTPDFLRKPGALEIVVAAKPDVFNHNLETVPSKYLKVRPGARYFHSIRLLQQADSSRNDAHQCGPFRTSTHHIEVVVEHVGLGPHADLEGARLPREVDGEIRIVVLQRSRGWPDRVVRRRRNAARRPSVRSCRWSRR